MLVCVLHVFAMCCRSKFTGGSLVSNVLLVVFSTVPAAFWITLLKVIRTRIALEYTNLSGKSHYYNIVSANKLKTMLEYKITTHGEFLELKNHGHYRSPHAPNKTEVLEELPNTDY